MTILFDIDFLEHVARSDPTTLRLTLGHFYRNRPVSKYKKYTQYSRARMYGKSFIKNPEPVISDNITDPSYLAQYIRLAARRSYLLYKIYGILYLDLSAYPDIDISNIKHNPLLTIANNKIYFKHESI